MDQIWKCNNCQKFRSEYHFIQCGDMQGYRNRNVIHYCSECFPLCVQIISKIIEETVCYYCKKVLWIMGKGCTNECFYHLINAGMIKNRICSSCWKKECLD